MTQTDRTIRRRLHGALFKLPLMINCAAFEDFILAYLDDELPARQKAVFDLHLMLCRECRDYLQEYRSSMRLVREALLEDDPAPAPGDVPQRLIDAIVAARRAE